MTEEMIIEVDENDKKIGLRPRKDFYKDKNLIHRSSHLLLFNSKGELLSQKRAADKIWYPDLYEFSTSGGVNDETYEQCIRRETKEELGIEVPVKKFIKMKHFDEVKKAFATVYFAQSDKKIKIEKKEIQNIKWIPLKELKNDLMEVPSAYAAPFRKAMGIYFEKYGTSLPEDL